MKDEKWERLKNVILNGNDGKVPVSFIVDSPWIPGFYNIDTLDYYLDENLWFDCNMNLRTRFPDVTWFPGFWWEYGMGIEASAFGGRLVFHHGQPPSIDAINRNLDFWAENIKTRNPETDGLMPFALRQIERMDKRLEPYGLGEHIASSRGLLTVTSWFMGIDALMVGLAGNDGQIDIVLKAVKETIILWLEAQLKRMREPDGIMILDDLIGMISPRMYKRMIEPLFQDIWNHFDCKIKFYHNDTPCEKLYPALSNAGFNVFNFSYKADIAKTLTDMGDKITLFGNVAPRDLGMLGTPDQVYDAAVKCMDQAEGKENFILSFGGGISQKTPEANINAMVKAADDWNTKKQK